MTLVSDVTVGTILEFAGETFVVESVNDEGYVRIASLVDGEQIWCPIRKSGSFGDHKVIA